MQTQNARASPAAALRHAGPNSLRAIPADPWIQLLACVALLSGALTLLTLQHGPQPAAATTVPIHGPPVSQPEPTRTPSPSPAPAEAPPTAALGQDSISLIARPIGSRTADPRTAGRWVVDAGMGPGADRATLAEALSSAREGDVISVRPGVYREALVFSKSLTVVGEGNGSAEVRIESDKPATVAVTGGQAIFRNLTIFNSARQTDASAFNVSNAQARLENVAVESSFGRGVHVSHGGLALERAALRGLIGLFIEDRGSADCAECTWTGTGIGAAIKGTGSSARIDRSRFEGVLQGISVSEGAGVEVSNSDFRPVGSKGGGGLLAFRGTSVKILSSRFFLEESAGAGLYAEAATVVGDDLTIQGSRGMGVEAKDGASVTLDRARITGSHCDGLFAQKRARVTLRQSTLADNDVCGAQVENAEVSFDRVVVEGNHLCGVGFVDGGTLEANNSRFRNQPLGAVYVKPGSKGLVTLRGSGNEGLPFHEHAFAGRR
jgi:hypothetical protein